MISVVSFNIMNSSKDNTQKRMEMLKMLWMIYWSPTTLTENVIVKLTARVEVLLVNGLAKLSYTLRSNMYRKFFALAIVNLAAGVNSPTCCCFWWTWLNIYILCCHTAFNFYSIFHENNAWVKILSQIITISVFVKELVIEFIGVNLSDAQHVTNL